MIVVEKAGLATEIFDSEEFWQRFLAELSRAKSRVILQSPFLKLNRLRLLAASLCDLRSRNITVCAFIQEPVRVKGVDEDQLAELNMNVDILHSMGVHVNIRQEIHAKFVLIDETVLWEGSLNTLSHAKKKEHMRRWNSKTQFDAIAKKHALLFCEDCLASLLWCGIPSDESSRLEKLGELLSTKRRLLNLTQRELSMKMDLHHSIVQELERGKNVTVESLFRILQALELTAFFLPSSKASAVATFINPGGKDLDARPGRIGGK